MKQPQYTVRRKTDKLGRLVIPHDMREMYGILPNEEVTLLPQENGILILPPEEKNHIPQT